MSWRERVGWIAALLLTAAAAPLRLRDAPAPLPPVPMPSPCPAVSSAPIPRWAPLAPRAEFAADPLIWDVLTHPDQFVGKEIELTGYAILGFEFAYLAQTPHELRNFQEWQTSRPREHPSMHLLALQLPRSDTRQGFSHLNGRRVRVQGRLLPAVDPREPEPALRWAYGMMFAVDVIDER